MPEVPSVVDADVNTVETSVNREEKTATNPGELNSSGKSKQLNSDAVFKRQTSNQRSLSTSRSNSAAKARKALPAFGAAVDRSHDEFETQSVNSQVSLLAGVSSAETSTKSVPRRKKKAAQVTSPGASIELV
jgi:hypothetical protein